MDTHSQAIVWQKQPGTHRDLNGRTRVSSSYEVIFRLNQDIYLEVWCASLCFTFRYYYFVALAAAAAQASTSSFCCIIKILTFEKIKLIGAKRCCELTKQAFIKRHSSVSCFHAFFCSFVRSFTHSLIRMQYICSSNRERKQIKNAWKYLHLPATAAVIHNLLFFALFICWVKLIVWEKAVSHSISVFCMRSHSNFILISTTL